MAERHDPQIQALAKGMEILRILTNSPGPVTATELARRTDMHQSTASRVLQTLTGLGHVRKTSGGFVPDYGVLGLAQAISKFPLVAKLQRTLEEVAEDNPGHLVNLAMLFKGDISYLVRAQAGVRSSTMWGFPLHVSSAALRILADLPRDEAIDLLRASRLKNGWEQTPNVPDSEEDVIDWAKAHVNHDVLVLDGWSGDSISGAIPIDAGEEHPVVLAIAGAPAQATTTTSVAFMLHDARRRVEAVTSHPKGP